MLKVSPPLTLPCFGIHLPDLSLSTYCSLMGTNDEVCQINQTNHYFEQAHLAEFTVALGFGQLTPLFMIDPLKLCQIEQQAFVHAARSSSRLSKDV